MSTLTKFVQFWKTTSFPSLQKVAHVFQQDHSSFVGFWSNVFFPRPFRDLHSLSANACVTSVFPVVPSCEVPSRFSAWNWRLDPDDPSIKGRNWEAVEKAPGIPWVFLMKKCMDFWLYADFFSFLEGGRIFFLRFSLKKLTTRKSPPFFFLFGPGGSPHDRCVLIWVSIRFFAAGDVS